MSNPAIVLMTDPSRCSLGDVHYLLQALLEMQQMGEHAVPQAFCDHPAAAKGFLEAYAHAYPQLVLQDGEIPTPDYLQALIANGQVNALAQPPELAPFGAQAAFGAASRPTEPSSSSGFPIVVLTLGSSHVLIDAMQQSPAMKDSIRLIDIVPDGAGTPPVSVAEAIAHGGLDGDSAWEADGLGAGRPELDEVAGASRRAAGDLPLEHDPLDLDGVEAVEATSPEAAHDDYAGGVPAPATFQPSTPVEPTPTAAAEPAAAEPAAAESPPAEPVAEQASAVETVWPAEVAVQPVTEPGTLVDDVAGTGEEPDEVTADAEDKTEADEAVPGKNAGHEDVDGEDIAHEDTDKGVLDDDDDVYYPPVGNLLVGSDVFYPALDQAAAQGVLQELVSVMLDDAIFDPDQAFEGLSWAPDDLAPTRLRVEEEATIRTSDNVVTIEDLYGSFDQETEDVFADSGVARPSHETDL